VVGLGVQSPIGQTPDELAAALRESSSGIVAQPGWGRIEGMECRVGGACPEELDLKAVPRVFRRSMGRVGILAALAAQDAVADSGLDEAAVASPSCGVSFGSTHGSVQAQEEFTSTLFQQRSTRGLQSSTYLRFMSHTCAANLGILFRTRGPIIASCTACTAGSQGIGFGYQAIKYGQAEMMITGGAEELHFGTAVIFDLMRATSTGYNDRPDRTPRPFDADRDGLVVGEGAGCLVLEEWNRAKRRGAKIYAELLGFGTNCNGRHITHSDANGVAECIQAALKDARMDPDRIDYINAHATATETGDLAEAEGTHQVLGRDIPISGIKGQTGHTLGASGALESVATIMMIIQGFMAATRNLERPDPNLPPLEHIIGSARERNLKIALNNSFAFGGINASLIFGKV